MADHRVRFVPDDLLDGRDFVFCNSDEDGVWLYIRRGVRGLPEVESEAVWEAAWATYRDYAEVGEIIPLQRDRNADLAELLKAAAQ